SADYAGDEAVDIFLRQTRKHARPMFYINCGYRDLCYCYSKVTRHHYCCSCDVGACFPAYARVSTPGGAHTTMDRLRTGDKVLADVKYLSVWPRSHCHPHPPPAPAPEPRAALSRHRKIPLTTGQISTMSVLLSVVVFCCCRSSSTV
ncbi:hypothetical protein C7M84_024339, partial [Penaeus vannamei]